MENENARNDIPDGDEEVAVEKTMADRAKEVGRDGAYLEIEAKDLVAAYRSGELQKSNILIIKAFPIEFPSPMEIGDCARTIKDAIDKVSGLGSEYYELSDEQLGYAIIRNCMLKGMR